MLNIFKRLDKIENRISGIETIIDKQKNEKKFEKIPKLPFPCSLCGKRDFRKPLKGCKMWSGDDGWGWVWVWVCEGCLKGKK